MKPENATLDYGVVDLQLPQVSGLLITGSAMPRPRGVSNHRLAPFVLAFATLTNPTMQVCERGRYSYATSASHIGVRTERRTGRPANVMEVLEQHSRHRSELLRRRKRRWLEYVTEGADLTGESE